MLIWLILNKGSLNFSRDNVLMNMRRHGCEAVAIKLHTRLGELPAEDAWRRLLAQVAVQWHPIVDIQFWRPHIRLVLAAPFRAIARRAADPAGTDPPTQEIFSQYLDTE